MNGGESPCRKRSRCLVCSCGTCGEAVGEGQTGGDQSSVSTGGSSVGSACGPGQGAARLEPLRG